MEVSIEIPAWVVDGVRGLERQSQTASQMIATGLHNTVDFLNHQNNLWWFLCSLVIFWPIWVYFVVTITAASTWIFWLLASVVTGILQVIYVTYQFIMIATDVSVLTFLKTYQLVMRSRFVNTIFFFSKRLRNSRQRTSQRCAWRMQCENAKSYNDFLQIQMHEPPSPIEDKNGDCHRDDALESSSSRLPADSNSPVSSPISLLRRESRNRAQDDSALPPFSQNSAKPADSSPERSPDSSRRPSGNSLSTRSSNPRIRRQHSYGALRTLHENQESDPNDPASPNAMSPPRFLRSTNHDVKKLRFPHFGFRNHRTSDGSSDDNERGCSSNGKTMNCASNGGTHKEERYQKEIMRADLGPMVADLLPSTTARLKEARQAYVDEKNEDKSLEHLLCGVVKRNHLTLEDLLVENGRSLAESGQYRYSLSSRKLISSYYFEVSKGIDAVAEGPANSSDPLVELSSRMTLLRKMKQNIGRTALMLSGGGAQAMYHLGTIRALIDAGLYEEIKVISGTSGGSITAAMCAIKTPQEMHEHVCIPTVSSDFMLNGRMKKENIRWFPPIKDMVTYWLKHGLLVDSAEFRRTCEFYYSDTTFAEAFERTGKHVCITVSASRASGGTVQRLLLNHISTPHVTLASAVAASCALPGVMAPAKLQIKSSNGELEPFEVDGVEWIDGSVQADLPFQRISTLFNVSNYVVAQTNFHVMPFLRKAYHPSTRSLYWRVFQTMEWDIRSRALKLSRLGLFPKVFGQDLSKVFKQKYYGNLTLVPRFTAMQTFGMKALVNPTVRDMEGYLKYGQIAAWPYLSVLRDMMRLETALDYALARLKERCQELYPEFADLDTIDFDDLESIASGGASKASFTSPGGHRHRLYHHSRRHQHAVAHHTPHHAHSSGSLSSGVGGHPPRLVRFSNSSREGDGQQQHNSLRSKVSELQSENAKLKKEMDRMRRLLKNQRQQQEGPGQIEDGTNPTISSDGSSGSNSEVNSNDDDYNNDGDHANDSGDDSTGAESSSDDGKSSQRKFDDALTKHNTDERNALAVVKQLSLISD